MEAFNIGGQTGSFHENRKIKIFLIIFGIAVLTFAANDAANAKDRYTTDFNNYYGTNGTDRGTTMGSCITCHVGSDGKGGTNSYGNHWKSYGQNFAAIEALDSDGGAIRATLVAWLQSHSSRRWSRSRRSRGCTS